MGIEQITETLWSMYPGCHLHLDVTTAGVNSYRIVVSIVDEGGTRIQRITYYGSGDLATIKDQALMKLWRSLEPASV